MLVALLALAMAMPASPSAAPPGVTGLWRTAGDEGLIQIEACGAEICGRIASDSLVVALPPTNARHQDTHDGATDGLLILKLKPTGPDRWGDGWIYNPDDHHRYKASIALTDDGRLRLKGCLVGPLCRTQTWTRADRLARRGAPAAAGWR